MKENKECPYSAVEEHLTSTHEALGLISKITGRKVGVDPKKGRRKRKRKSINCSGKFKPFLFLVLSVILNRNMKILCLDFF